MMPKQNGDKPHRMTIPIDPALHKRLRKITYETRIPAVEIILDGLEKRIERAEKKVLTR